MTVDMLAATFFWPEGVLLGPPPPHDPDPAEPAGAPDALAGEGERESEGFWSAVMRHLWRPSSAVAAG